MSDRATANFSTGCYAAVTQRPAVKSNPLSTRFVEPGKLAWRAAAGQSLAELVARFTDQLQSRAAIVGPHGSGKSTFLENFVPLLGKVELRAAAHEESDPPNDRSAAGDESFGSALRDGAKPSRTVVWLKMRGGAASRRLLFQTYRLWAEPHCILVIDGYEQLSSAARGAALLLTRLNSAGMLVTSHKPTALPTLLETRVDVPLAQELLCELLPDELEGRDRLLDAVRLEQRLDKHHGNLREVFMELYDEL